MWSNVPAHTIETHTHKTNLHIDSRKMNTLRTIAVACMAGATLSSASVTPSLRNAELSVSATPGKGLMDLPYSFHDAIGPFDMRWGFVGTGSDEMIEIEFSLPSDIYIGLGLGCTSSAKCDMIVGNGGGRNKEFVEDQYEPLGDREGESDVSLGGTEDLTLVSASYEDWRSILRVRRKLNTGDKYDHVIKKAKTPIVYAWCAAPYCSALDTPHAPGDWQITSVDFGSHAMLQQTPTNNANMFTQLLSLLFPPETFNNANGATDDCYAGSESLCSCSQLSKRHWVASLDDCTQTAAISYCEAHGPCEA
eukprot:GFYU01014062.1.p1 GENE.GFYU01014062.1~~GFYU01014062.1.p1  ORF type:complete len:307 (+),score=70.32 GFYU01014062.1:32-952(+)